MPPRRQEQEKGLMSIQEVEENFPVTTYKDWLSSRSTRDVNPRSAVLALTSQAPSIRTKTIQAAEEASAGRQEEDDRGAGEQDSRTQPLEWPGSSDDTCAICMDILDAADNIRGLTCGHPFHAVCADEWLTGRKACCPLCKAEYHVEALQRRGRGEGITSREAVRGNDS
jgi:hypothetical protein